MNALESTIFNICKNHSIFIDESSREEYFENKFSYGIIEKPNNKTYIHRITFDKTQGHIFICINKKDFSVFKRTQSSFLQECRQHENFILFFYELNNDQEIFHIETHESNVNIVNMFEQMKPQLILDFFALHWVFYVDDVFVSRFELGTNLKTKSISIIELDENETDTYFVSPNDITTLQGIVKEKIEHTKYRGKQLQNSVYVYAKEHQLKKGFECSSYTIHFRFQNNDFKQPISYITLNGLFCPFGTFDEQQSFSSYATQLNTGLQTLSLLHSFVEIAAEFDPDLFICIPRKESLVHSFLNLFKQSGKPRITYINEEYYLSFLSFRFKKRGRIPFTISNFEQIVRKELGTLRLQSLMQDANTQKQMLKNIGAHDNTFSYTTFLQWLKPYKKEIVSVFTKKELLDFKIWYESTK